MKNKVAILDYGSQYTQLIARRCANSRFIVKYSRGMCPRRRSTNLTPALSSSRGVLPRFTKKTPQRCNPSSLQAVCPCSESAMACSCSPWRWAAGSPRRIRRNTVWQSWKQPPPTRFSPGRSAGVDVAWRPGRNPAAGIFNAGQFIEQPLCSHGQRAAQDLRPAVPP